MDGNEIKRRRLARGMTLRALASRLGASHVSVWQWENGVHKPTAATRKLLERVLREPKGDK